MPETKTEQIVRQFHENGMKLLLENPKNAGDLLSVTAADVVKLVDVNRMQLVQTTFVQRDYRHVESDVVLIAPLKKKRGGRLAKKLMIYILIEHQSDPDRLMPLRLLDYVVQVFKFQTREWSKTHRSFARLRFEPVLPVVFYTGTRRWESVGKLVDLVELGKQFESATPAMEPLFINLSAIEPETLESEGGFFGWVLRLVQQRKSRPKEFRELLNRVVQHLESMPSSQRLRWLELLSYIVALVYHVRNPQERPHLQDAIEASVQTDEHRQELSKMGKTIADELKEAGAVAALRGTLIDQLETRFGELPQDIKSTIQTTDEVVQLRSWLKRVVTSSKLDDIGIESGD